MPPVSKAQQKAMAIAEHAPSKLLKRNRGLLKMSHEQLHDFAATKTKNLPAKKSGGELHSYDHNRPKRKVVSRYY